MDQSILLNEMIENNMNSILIKVCTMGLNKEDLMKSLKEMKDKLITLKNKFGVNVCGEGGEYESITLDCPIYKKRIVIDNYDIICHRLMGFLGQYTLVVLLLFIFSFGLLYKGFSLIFKELLLIFINWVLFFFLRK